MRWILKSVFCLYITSNMLAQTWINDSGINYAYVYAPGLNASETQLAKYCPTFIASTGECVSCARGIETIQKNVAACTFAEVALSSDRDVALFVQRAAQVSVGLLFASLAKKHLNFPSGRILKATLIPSSTYLLWPQINHMITRMANMQYGITIEKNNELYERSVACHHTNLLNINIGQKADIAILRHTIEEHMSLQSEGSKLILYGVSRGAATVFNYCATFGSENIAAIVCEGIFDSLDSIAHYAGGISQLKIKLLKSMGITAYNAQGICPLYSADFTRFDKPIALITSLTDEEVPFQCTLNLYKKLRQRGFSKVHLLILNSSKHSSYPIGHEKGRYQQFIHAFYKKYSLPFIDEWAQAGKYLLDDSQPDEEQVDCLLSVCS